MSNNYRLLFKIGAQAEPSLGKVIALTHGGIAKLDKAGQHLGKGLKAPESGLAGISKTGGSAGRTNVMLAQRFAQTQRNINAYAQSLRTSNRRLREHTAAAKREKQLQGQLRAEYNRTAKSMRKLAAGGRAGATAGGKGAPGLSELAGVAAPVLAVSLPVKKAMEFESAMAGVRKVVNFAEPDGLNKFGQELTKLSTKEIPISAAGLAEIAAAGGQLGIAEKDLLSYVKTTAKMAVAFDMLPDEAGDASAKLSNVFKIPVSQIGKLGDAINHLSDNTPAKAREITRAMLRVGGTSQQFGLSAQNTSALAAAFIGLGKPPEVAGTAINGMLVKLMTAEKGGKAFSKALNKIGFDAYDLKSAIQNDAQGALTSFLESIAQMDKAEQMGVLVDLFGREYADDVATLVGSLDSYKKALGLVAKEQSYLGSMNKEFQNQANTTANKATLLGNKLGGLLTGSGTNQLPVFNSLLATAGGVLDVMSGLSTEFPKVSSGLAHLVGGAAAAIAVFKGLKLAGRFFKSGFSDIASFGRKGFNLARGKRGKRGRGGKGGAVGGLLGAASGATPVYVVNMPSGGLGGLGDMFGSGFKGKGKAGRFGKIGRGLARFGRKGFLGKAAGLAGRVAAGAGGLLGMGGGAVGMSVAGAGAKSAASGVGLLAKAGKFLGKGAGKGLLKAGGKSLLKKIPGIGLLAGIGFGISRALEGDWLGAAGEVASGAAGMIPVVGTAASIALDAGLAARDMAKESTTAESEAKPQPELDAATPQPELARYATGESTFNIDINQTVNAPGADAASLKNVLGDGREELKRAIQKVVEEIYWQQQRTGFNNA